MRDITANSLPSSAGSGASGSENLKLISETILALSAGERKSLVSCPGGAGLVGTLPWSVTVRTQQGRLPWERTHTGTHTEVQVCTCSHTCAHRLMCAHREQRTPSSMCVHVCTHCAGMCVHRCTCMWAVMCTQPHTCAHNTPTHGTHKCTHACTLINHTDARISTTQEQPTTSTDPP